MHLVVKREAHGFMSRSLHRMSPGDEVEMAFQVRGPERVLTDHSSRPKAHPARSKTQQNTCNRIEISKQIEDSQVEHQLKCAETYKLHPNHANIKQATRRDFATDPISAFDEFQARGAGRPEP